MLVLIMAGGAGTRFWPKSRERHPKQLLPITGEATMLQNTVRRVQPLVPEENIFVISNAVQYPGIIEQLPMLPPENIIVEPRPKNTAACIGLGAIIFQQRERNGVMVVLPADHLIDDDDVFRQTLLDAAKIAAEKDVLITIGIQPTYPATGYGYIQFNEEKISVGEATAYRVKTFAEKPNLETAKRFLDSGDFLWNSGIFVWRIPVIMAQIEEHLPHLYDGLQEIIPYLGKPEQDQIIDRVYQQIKSISIDYGVMENARNVVVLRGQFRWNDLGSWDEVYKLLPKDQDHNATYDNNHVLLESSGCLIDVPGKIVAALGIRDLMVVETEDALLLCPRNRAQEVKELVELIKRRKLHHLL
ncbi:MAG: sugar phosphate nucleotidyltransferase [candidate division KSB1 bacterium]|nr:sugar phosphate nucleotidyltransferase [candidate division KSB1 bacterium]MDZ7305014.1 sugar phosphate nucleotidyltransferase [candidate division KSB1 bacterium]MDZ7314141.1 sugar phosphate nucleotidyltransferase [candidate division KSB1 bacterium]